MGGAVQDVTGEIQGIYWGYIGENTNNVVKFKALLAGMDMVMTNGWFPIILEGDSQLILQMAVKLLNGKPVHKVVDNWRMANNLEQLRSLLIVHSEVQIHHVKCKTNKLADLLANHGVDSGQEVTYALWQGTVEETLWEKCQIVMEQDYMHPRCG